MSDPKNSKVKWYNQEKGYGFLVVDGFDKDVFVHVKQLRNSGITGTITEGDQYACQVNDGPKGPFATNLSKINQATA